jgi:hypothetical protein
MYVRVCNSRPCHVCRQLRFSVSAYLDLPRPKRRPLRRCDGVIRVATLSHALRPSLAAIAAPADLMLWGFGGGFVAALAIRFLGQSVFRLLDRNYL